MTELVHFNSEELRRLYLVEGLTVEAIARRLGCGATTVIRRLAALGVPRRPRGPQPVSRTNFAVWSAPLAYAVGLMATDGNLSPDGRHLSLTSKDADLLQTMKTILISMLRYAKHDSIQLLNWLYYAPDVPCLTRKRDKARPFLADGAKSKHSQESRL